MRKTLCASVLLLSLCGSAFAGDAGCPPIAPGDISCPPSMSQPSADQTNDGPTNAEADTAADDLAATTLSIINSMMALL